MLKPKARDKKMY
ncbi:hypothetical protein IEO21_09775 [Rhodonia placenta]|nr:hypothetical protein IEO21_10223 [Postia placenta]KAF9802966.1 hypothetical protein IEO21_09775 [Postia placenta]